MRNEEGDADNSCFGSDFNCDCSFESLGDNWVDYTFPSVPNILDSDDLKVNGLMCPTLTVYQVLYVGIFFALFYTNFLNEAKVLYLAPSQNLKPGKYCVESPISITASYWIDEKGHFEGDSNYDSSHTLYRIGKYYHYRYCYYYHYDYYHRQSP